MPEVKLRTNAASPDVKIGDIGEVIPGSGQVINFSRIDDLLLLASSDDLINLSNDDAFGPGSHSIEVFIDNVLVDPASVSDALRTIFIPRSGPFSLPVRDEQGDETIQVSGITEQSHEELDTLTHDLSEDYYATIQRTGFLVTNVTFWTDVTQTTKIREVQVSYNGFKADEVVSIQYDENGAVKEQTTLSIGYVGFLISSLTQVKS